MKLDLYQMTNDDRRLVIMHGTLQIYLKHRLPRSGEGVMRKLHFSH